MILNIEASLMICSAYQFIGFYMKGILVVLRLGIIYKFQ